MVGEGMSLFGAIAGMLVALILFVEGMAWLMREWSHMVDEDAYADENLKAAAMVPEAAAQRPFYHGRCRCGCRSLPQEPCSDFDGD